MIRLAILGAPSDLREGPRIRSAALYRFRRFERLGCLLLRTVRDCRILEHVSAEQNRKVPGRIKGFPRGCLWVILLALILVWRPSDAKLVYCRDA